MQSFRENPDGEENQKATRETEAYKKWLQLQTSLESSVDELVQDKIIERMAQLLAHRACGNQEQDIANGKLAGYCVVCQVLWPCDVAKQKVYPDMSNAPTQATKCAVCGHHKHTPLRNDTMGGYVCLTCIDTELTRLQSINLP